MRPSSVKILAGDRKLLNLQGQPKDCLPLKVWQRTCTIA